jgi:hypothetical protein
MEHLSSSNSHLAETDLLELHRELAQAWGIDFQRVRALVCQLTSSSWCSVSELIARTLLSHWNVTHLLRRLQPGLECDQDHVRIRVAFQDLFRTVYDCSNLSNVFFLTPYEIAAKAGEEAAQAEAVLASMERVVNDLPLRPVRHLDHVSATPLTCLKRALFLAKNYDLGGATILLLGDHDLTSLALAQVAPSVAITVVDSDERILDYISMVSAQHGWTIRTLFADLRLALPRSVEASCDLVFTDPPYTPEGMRLFLARGLESLRPSSSARLLFCYGFSERHPGLGLKVQSVLHDLHLVTEAILPHFNRYLGAEETTMMALPRDVVDTVKRSLAAQTPERVLLVGDGWPNAWREALIARGTDQGRRLSKNQARQVIERQRLGMIHAPSYLSELSLSDLRALVIAVEQTFMALGQRVNEEEPE